MESIKNDFEDRKLAAIEQRTVDDDKLKLVFSNEELKDKIRMSMDEDGSTLWWYITFNIALDIATLSSDTVNVTDIEGYIIDTSMRYEHLTNRIAIRPAKPYIDNQYYLLNISKEVKAANGQPLKDDIHILFKVMDNKIFDVEILKSTVKVPPPRKRPTNDNGTSKYYTFLKERGVPQGVVIELPYIDVKFPVVSLVFCFMFFVASLLVENDIIQGVCLFLGLLLGSFSLYSVFEKDTWSKTLYNFGVYAFMKEKYKRAYGLFVKAYEKDPENEPAEYAISRSKFYVDM